MSSPNAWGSLRERGDRHIMLVVGLISLMDPDRDSLCWGLMLQKEIRLLVGLSGGRGGWWFLCMSVQNEIL